MIFVQYDSVPMVVGFLFSSWAQEEASFNVIIFFLYVYC